MKKTMKDQASEDGSRRVLARVLAENLYNVQGSASSTRLDGPAPDQDPPQSSELSEAATSESIPDH